MSPKNKISQMGVAACIIDEASLVPRPSDPARDRLSWTRAWFQEAKVMFLSRNVLTINYAVLKTATWALHGRGC